MNSQNDSRIIALLSKMHNHTTSRYNLLLQVDRDAVRITVLQRKREYYIGIFHLKQVGCSKRPTTVLSVRT